MSNLSPKPPSAIPPTCCGQPAVWVDHGHRLRYWYCRTCKKEVGNTPAHWRSDGPFASNDALFLEIPTSATDDQDTAFYEILNNSFGGD